MLKFIEAKGLVEHLDFQVISYFLLDEEYDMKIKLVNDGENLSGYYPTRFDGDGVETFYGPISQLDAHLMEAIGLGAVELLYGEYNGYKFLYNFDISEDEFSDRDECLKVGMYFQLTEPNVDFQWLERFMRADEYYLRLLLLDHHDFVIKRLEEVFRTKKKGVVLPFKKT